MTRHRTLDGAIDGAIDDSLDALCRDAVRAHRIDAFDDVDVDVVKLLGPEPLSIGDARWIGRHPMENGRALAACRDGQAILEKVRSTDREGSSVDGP